MRTALFLSIPAVVGFWLADFAGGRDLVAFLGFVGFIFGIWNLWRLSQQDKKLDPIFTQDKGTTREYEAALEEREALLKKREARHLLKRIALSMLLLASLAILTVLSLALANFLEEQEREAAARLGIRSLDEENNQTGFGVPIGGQPFIPDDPIVDLGRPEFGVPIEEKSQGIRLLEKEKEKAAIRKVLLVQQDYECAACKNRFRFNDSLLKLDHIIEKANGGSESPENLQLLCLSCDLIKGDRGMDYLMEHLRNRKKR